MIPGDWSPLADRLARRPPVESSLDWPWAAVALILAPGPPSLLLIRRAIREGDVWSGHLAVPGGRAAPDDPDLLTTARRETREEVGLDLGSTAPIGRLDDLATGNPTLPPLIVRPFVFLVDRPLPLTLSAEVAGAWWVPLGDLRRPGVLAPYAPTGAPPIASASGYHLPIGVLWGMTERIVTPLLDLALPIAP